MIVIAYGLAVLTTMLQAGEPNAFWWWLLFFPFYAWWLAPVGLPLFYPWPSWFITLPIGAMAAYSSHIYERDMFGPGARSTSALIFIFLPIYQWMAVGVLIGVAWLTRRLTK
ncbi:MAG TPA: hypothetical protein VFU20_05860 [Sphingomicrobium sp.]|nr:hypothetical protein [Sphingomicrobium sp.]